MSFYRRRAVVLWGLVAAIWLFATALNVLFLLVRPDGERGFYAGGIIVYAALAFLFWAWQAARVARGMRANASAGGVVFVALNHRGALVYAERFLVAGHDIARGQMFIVVVGEVGLEYRAPHRGAPPFVRIPWTEIDEVFEVVGELGIALRDDGVQYLVPGGIFPLGVRRVRALAAEISALRRERQP